MPSFCLQESFSSSLQNLPRHRKRNEEWTTNYSPFVERTSPVHLFIISANNINSTYTDTRLLIKGVLISDAQIQLYLEKGYGSSHPIYNLLYTCIAILLQKGHFCKKDMDVCILLTQFLLAVEKKRSLLNKLLLLANEVLPLRILECKI